MSTAPFVQPTLPKPPSEAQMARMLEELQPGLTVYNPAPEWVAAEVHGITRWLPPDLDGAVLQHPATGQPVECNGEVIIRGRRPLIRTKGGEMVHQTDSSGKKIEGQEAVAIVKFLVAKEHFGQQGVVWLPGRSADEDEALRYWGRQKYLEFKQMQDEELLDKRREFKQNWLRNPAKSGVPVPPPTPAQNAAMVRSQTRQKREAYQYECNVAECPGLATNNWEDFSQHMALAHRVAAAISKDGEVTLTREDGAKSVLGKAKAFVGQEVAAEPRPEIEEAAAAAAGEPEGPPKPQKLPKKAPRKVRKPKE